MLKSEGLRLRFLGICTTLVPWTLRFAGTVFVEVENVDRGLVLREGGPYGCSRSMLPPKAKSHQKAKKTKIDTKKIKKKWVPPQWMPSAHKLPYELDRGVMFNTTLTQNIDVDSRDVVRLARCRIYSQSRLLSMSFQTKPWRAELSDIGSDTFSSNSTATCPATRMINSMAETVSHLLGDFSSSPAAPTAPAASLCPGVECPAHVK